jgi:hypothetical protein
MTLDEIADTLPNGFHDARINSLSVNYVKRELTFDLEIWVSDSLQDDSELYRSAELKLFQFLFLVIEPPDPRYDYHEEKPLWVDGGSAEPTLRSAARELPALLPEGAFTYSFFVHDWNTFIHLAARDASISLL